MLRTGPGGSDDPDRPAGDSLRRDGCARDQRLSPRDDVGWYANDITRQVLRSSQKDGERIQMENTAKLDDSDEVEIIVVVNDSVADPDSRAQVNALLRTQKSALAQIERALDTKVEPQRQYTTLLKASPPR